MSPSSSSFVLLHDLSLVRLQLASVWVLISKSCSTSSRAIPCARPSARCATGSTCHKLVPGIHVRAMLDERSSKSRMSAHDARCNWVNLSEHKREKSAP